MAEVVCSPHLSGAPDKDLVQYPASALQKWQWFLNFLSLTVDHLPHLHDAINFSFFWFLRILLLEETFVRLQVLQRRVRGLASLMRTWGL